MKDTQQGTGDPSQQQDRGASTPTLAEQQKALDAAKAKKIADLLKERCTNLQSWKDRDAAIVQELKDLDYRRTRTKTEAAQ